MATQQQVPQGQPLELAPRGNMALTLADSFLNDLDELEEDQEEEQQQEEQQGLRCYQWQQLTGPMTSYACCLRRAPPSILEHKTVGRQWTTPTTAAILQLFARYYFEPAPSFQKKDLTSHSPKTHT